MGVDPRRVHGGDGRGRRALSCALLGICFSAVIRYIERRCRYPGSSVYSGVCLFGQHGFSLRALVKLPSKCSDRAH